MVLATYRLARQTASWRRFAAVSVDVTASTCDGHQVTVTAAADPDRRREAELGARHALQAVRPAGGGRQVTVTDIVATEVDTGIGDIHEATARAVWQAIGPWPQPAYVGFSEPDTVGACLRDRIGRRLEAVTEARHWHDGRRGPDADSLLHAWLHFHNRPPVMLHGRGDELFLSVSDPYPPYDIAEHGQTRVGTAQPPDLLGYVVGAHLTDAAVIVEATTGYCAGFTLRLDTTDILVATSADEWILKTDPTATAGNPSWIIAPVTHGETPTRR